MIKRDSQNARILLHLAKGKALTRYEAILMFRVQNITARMSELKKLIVKLDDVYQDPATETGSPCGIRMIEKLDPNKQSYAEYRITCRPCRQALGKYLSSLRRKRAA